LFSGKRFRLERATLAVEAVDGKRLAVNLPAGTLLKVISGPKNGIGLLNALWEGRSVEMFAVDVDVRGTEITD
jgi:hypothetical protein